MQGSSHAELTGWCTTCRGHCRFSSGQTETVLDVGRQEVVAAVLVLIALQVLVDLIDQ